MPNLLKAIPAPLHAPLYAAVRGVVAALGAAPTREAVRVARRFGRAWAGSGFNRARLRRAVDHLAVAFPEWDDSRRHEVALRAYEHLFMFAVETVATPRALTDDSWPLHVQIADLAGPLRVLLQGRPAVMITGHVGNWELLGYSLAALGFPVHALYRPLDLAPLDAWVRRTRQAHGLVLLDKFGAGEHLPGIMAHGGLPAFVADQNAGVRGLFVPFFNRLASTYKSIGLLAATYGAPIVCGLARRLDEDSPASMPADDAPTPILGASINLRSGLAYRIEVYDVIHPSEAAGQPDALFYLTARYRRAIEHMVRAVPDQYLWMHRYWKSRPRHEVLGKPCPGPLREKLAALPWMTPTDLDLIVRRSEADARASATPPARPAAAASGSTPAPPA